MKKIKFSMLAIMAAFAGFVSCEKPIETPPEPAKIMEINAEASYEVISTSARPVTFNINSNTPWTVESDAAWCKVSPASSDESSLVEEITVSFEDNEETIERTAKVTVTGAGIEAPTVITFKQAKKSSLEVEQITGIFEKTGGNQTFTITSNEAWTVEANADWVSFDKTSGSGTGTGETVTATCAANAGAIRKAVVTVTAGSLQKTFEIQQDGLYARFAEVSAETKVFKSVGETKVFEFETNIEDPAITVDDPSATAEITEPGKVSITLGVNSLFKDRKVTVTLNTKGTGTENLEGNALVVSQPVNWGMFPDNAPVEQILFDAETGYCTLTSRNHSEARIITLDWNTCARYEIEFEKFECDDNFLFDVIHYNKTPKVGWELALGKNQANGLENTLHLMAGGKAKESKGFIVGETYPKVEGWSGEKFSFAFTKAEAQAMKKLIVEFKLNTVSNEKIDILVQIDEKVLIKETVANPFLKKGTVGGKKYSYDKGGKVYFGFPPETNAGAYGDGQVIIKSAKDIRFPFK